MIKRSTRMIPALVIAAITLPLSGCTGTIVISPEWAKHYETLGEMAADADLIVAGEIISTEKVLSAGESESSPDVTFYVTHALLQVERSVKGYDGENITVTQPGAAGWGEEPGNPIFKTGEQCFLFLEEGENGIYGLMNPDCRFRIEDGKVSSMNYVLPDEAHVPEGLSFERVDIDAFAATVIEAARAAIIIPEGEPVISMTHWKIKYGSNDELSIYEDGTIIYIKEWELRFAGHGRPGKRALRTGKLSEEEMAELAGLIQNEEFVSLEGTYEYLEDEPQTVKIITTVATGDMQVDLNIDFAGVEKAIIATRFTSKDHGMTYPSMPYPLDDIYKTLKDIAENKTEEVYREEI